jgi:hypothetical protein
MGGAWIAIPVVARQVGTGMAEGDVPPARGRLLLDRVLAVVASAKELTVVALGEEGRRGSGHGRTPFKSC